MMLIKMETMIRVIREIKRRMMMWELRTMIIVGDRMMTISKVGMFGIWVIKTRRAIFGKSKVPQDGGQPTLSWLTNNYQ